MTNRIGEREPPRRLFQVTLSTDEGRMLSGALQVLRGMLNASGEALSTFAAALPPADQQLFVAGGIQMVFGGGDPSDPQARQRWWAVQAYLARLEQHLREWLAEGET